MEKDESIRCECGAVVALSDDVILRLAKRATARKRRKARPVYPCRHCQTPLRTAKERQVHEPECPSKPPLAAPYLRSGRTPKMKQCRYCSVTLPTVQLELHSGECRRKFLEEQKLASAVAANNARLTVFNPLE